MKTIKEILGCIPLFIKNVPLIKSYLRILEAPNLEVWNSRYGILEVRDERNNIAQFRNVNSELNTTPNMIKKVIFRF